MIYMLEDVLLLPYEGMLSVSYILLMYNTYFGFTYTIYYKPNNHN